ncbi:MAG TPA: four helix bundle protein [Flavisolibacter sp.]|nr:four helix bundle protein [Flavisolibacter sp.]
MPNLPAYKNLEVYNLSRKLVIACYQLTHDLPPEEKTNFTRYIRTAALNLHMNIAQGIFLKSKKRKKFIKAAKNALVIIDAGTDILVELGLTTKEDSELVSGLSRSCFELLDKV